MTEEKTFMFPLTREEINELKALSLKAYGKSSAWQKLLRKGELVDSPIMTSRGEIIKGKAVKYLTINDIYDRMVNIVKSMETKNGSDGK